MKTTQLTVDEANEIQAEWMAFEKHNDPAAVRKMTQRYAALPSSYLVTNEAGGWVPMIQGQPIAANPMTLQKAKEYGARWCDTVLAWNATKGEWIALPSLRDLAHA